MTYIEASEESFSRANNFYILMWIVTALVLITALIDFRLSRLEQRANEYSLEFYSKFERNAAKTADEIRSFVYLQPSFQNERQAIDQLRRQRS